MTHFLDVFWILFLILILAFDIYCVHNLITSRFGHYAPFVPTLSNQKKFILRKISNILRESSKPLTIIDAGCGCGHLLRNLALNFPQHQFVGIEWSLPLFKYCLWNSHKLNNLTFIRQDMFTYSFSEADIIICFLIPKMSDSFGQKSQAEIKEKCLIFSNGLKFKQLQLVEESPDFTGIFKQKVYIYGKNSL